MDTTALESMFRAYVAEHPGDAARALEALSAQDAAALVGDLPTRSVAPVLGRTRRRRCSDRWALMVVIVGAMIVNTRAAGLSGALIPLALRAAGRDPAQSSSIFLTTVTDIVGFAAFLGFASGLMSALE